MASPIEGTVLAMRILVYGAGVLGSLYAARLHDAGHDVTILARGERLAAIADRGIVIHDDATGQVTTSLVPVVDRLAPDERFDLVIVLVRRDQVTSVLPSLVESRGTPNVIFMGNNAAGPDELAAALGPSRVMLGFPGAGGAIVDGTARVRLAGARTLPTTIGEPDGSETDRLREVALVLRSAGFPVAISRDIDAWLKTHAALVVPLAGAVYGAEGDMGRLGRTPDLLILATRAMREGLAVLHALDIPVVPPLYRWLLRLPESALTGYMARAADTERTRLMVARHAIAARDEIATLVAELKALAGEAGIETPSFDRLMAYGDPSLEPMEDGSRTLVVHHPVRAAAVAGAAALAGLGIGLLFLRRTRPDLLATLPRPRLPAVPAWPAADRPRLRSLTLPAVTRPRMSTVTRPRLPAVTPKRLPALHLPAVSIAVFSLMPSLLASARSHHLARQGWLSARPSSLRSRMATKTGRSIVLRTVKVNGVRLGRTNRPDRA